MSFTFDEEIFSKENFTDEQLFNIIFPIKESFSYKKSKVMKATNDFKKNELKNNNTSFKKKKKKVK